MAMEEERITIRVPKKEKQKLQIIAFATGTTPSEIVRNMIHAYVANENPRELIENL